MNLQTDVGSEKVKNFNEQFKSRPEKKKSPKKPVKYAFQSTEHFTTDDGEKMVRRGIARKTVKSEVKGKANIKAAKRAKVKAMKRAE